MIVWSLLFVDILCKTGLKKSYASKFRTAVVIKSEGTSDVYEVRLSYTISGTNFPFAIMPNLIHMLLLYAIDAIWLEQLQTQAFIGLYQHERRWNEIRLR